MLHSLKVSSAEQIQKTSIKSKYSQMYKSAQDEASGERGAVEFRDIPRGDCSASMIKENASFEPENNCRISRVANSMNASRFKSNSVSVYPDSHTHNSHPTDETSAEFLLSPKAGSHKQIRHSMAYTNNLKSNATHISNTQSSDFNLSTKVIKNLQKWILCVSTVDFDENTGPVISKMYPKIDFTPSEEKTIKFSSIPDSTINQHCDVLYSYRFRTNPQLLKLEKDVVFLNAYVFFRQRADPLKKRGGMHRSIVVITPLSFHGLFIRIVETLGLLFFEQGEIAVETAFYNVASWPLPQDGKQLTLPFLGTVYQAELPVNNNAQIIETSRFSIKEFSPSTHILAGSVPYTLILNFQSDLKELWKLWEVMITAESLVVFADSPTKSFEVVTALINLISPIKYCGDFRPYFTVQDPDYVSIVSPKHVPPNTILGVTNPFFKYALSHWPNKLILKSATRIKNVGPINRSPLASQSGGLYKEFFSTSNSKPSKGIFDLGQKKDNIFTMQSKSRSQVAPNVSLVNHLVENIISGTQPPWVLNNTVQRYFYNLTSQFLVPLDRYFATLIPHVPSEFIKVKSINNYHHVQIFTSPPALGQWKNSDFFLSLQELGIPAELLGKSLGVKKSSVSASLFMSNIFSGSSTKTEKNAEADKPKGSGTALLSNKVGSHKEIKSKGLNFSAASSSWLEFYKKFTSCGNFATWLSTQMHNTQVKVWKQYFASIAEYDIDDWIFDSRQLIFRKTGSSANVFGFPTTTSRALHSAEQTEKLFFTISTPNPDLASGTDDSTFENINLLQPNSPVINHSLKLSSIPGNPKYYKRSISKSKPLYLSKGNSPAIPQHLSKPLIYDMNAVSKNKSFSNLDKLIGDVNSKEASQVAILGSRGTLVGFINKSSNNSANPSPSVSPNPGSNLSASASASARVSINGFTFSPKPGYNTDYTINSYPSSVNSSLTDLSFSRFSARNEAQLGPGSEFGKASKSNGLLSINSPYSFGAAFEPLATEKESFDESSCCRRSLEELCDMANFLSFILCVPSYFDNIDRKKQSSHLCTDTASKVISITRNNSRTVSQSQNEKENQSQSQNCTLENLRFSSESEDGSTKSTAKSSTKLLKELSIDSVYKPKFGSSNSGAHDKWMQRIPSRECLSSPHVTLIHKNYKKIISQLPDNLYQLYNSQIDMLNLNSSPN